MVRDLPLAVGCEGRKVVHVVHTVLECTCLAVGILVEETVVGHSCTPYVTFGGNIKEHLTWACLGDRRFGEGRYRTGSEGWRLVVFRKNRVRVPLPPVLGAVVDGLQWHYS
jgi:hypothetical protein